MNDNRLPLVSIITLNYNQLKITCEFVESLKKLSYSNYEIIVIDNASVEDPTPALHNINPDVRVILNSKNLGFSGGNNVGMKIANGDFFFIVNNDTEVTPSLINLLLKPFQEHPSVGVVSPKIRYFSHPNIIQYAGYSPVNPYTGRNPSPGYGKEDHGQFDTPGYTSYAHGAAMLVKREVVEKVGLLPEIYFIYYEELDWSASIRKAGYQIYYQPSALIYHKESITMGKESVMKTYYHNRNRVLFMRRNTTSLQFTVFLMVMLFGVIPFKIFKYATRSQFRHVLYFLKAMLWNLTATMKRDKGFPQIIPIVKVNFK